MVERVCPKGVVLRIIEKRVGSASFRRAVLRNSFTDIGIMNFRSSMRLFWEGLRSSLENGSKAQANESFNGTNQPIKKVCLYLSVSILSYKDNENQRFVLDFSNRSLSICFSSCALQKGM